MQEQTLSGLPEGYEYKFPKKFEEEVISKSPITFEETLDPTTQTRTSFKIMGEAINDIDVSRNGIKYEKLDSAYKSLEGKPFLDSHNDSSYKTALGHVESVQLTPVNGGVSIRHVTDIDPKEEDYIRKVKRGDCNFVSISAIPEKVIKKKDHWVAPLSEFLHLAAVSVPGHRNSKLSGYLAEKFESTTESTMTDDKTDKKPDEDVAEKENKEAQEALIKQVEELTKTVKTLSEKLEEKNKEPEKAEPKDEKTKGGSVVVSGGASTEKLSLDERIKNTFYAN